MAPPAKASVALVEAEAHYGDTVHFEVIIPENEKDNVSLYVHCMQGEKIVYAAGGYPIQESFTLSSTAWPGGAAQGTATLEAFKSGNPSHSKVIAECQFDVLA